MKIALGTVQFGLPYGIANRHGQVSRAEAVTIIDYAKSVGIDTLDTAAAYGNSERLLGEIIDPKWKIISKLPPIPTGTRDVAHWVRTTVEKSLQLLRVNRLDGLLLHHPADLLGGDGVFLHNALINLKSSGLVKKTGISIYNPAELDGLIGRFPFEMVQAPFNVLDQRLVSSGWLARLHDLGIEVHVRSIFLQGLLLLDKLARPPQFSRWEGIWLDWDEYLRASNQTPLEACVRFASSSPIISRFVVGIDSRRQLEEIFTALDGATASLPHHLQCNDPQLLEPSRWESLTRAAD